MDRSEIRFFMSRIGSSKIAEGTKWVRGTCPLARWYHRGGIDKTPSFNISIAPSDESVCKCHACNARGSLMGLLWRLQDLTSNSNSSQFQELAMFLAKSNIRDVLKEDVPKSHQLMRRLEANADYSMTPVAAQQVEDPTKPMPELKERWLDRFKEVPKEVMTYLKGPRRRLNPKTILAWELGWHPYAHRIVIPIRDQEGRLVGLSGRAFRRGDKPKYLHGPKGQFKKGRLLYGLNMVSVSNKHAFLVEGFFHVLWLWQNGYDNAIAGMGTFLSPIQVGLLKSHFESITLVPDLGTEAATQKNFDMLSQVGIGPFGSINVGVADVTSMVRPGWMEEDADPDISDQPVDKLREILGPPNIS